MLGGEKLGIKLYHARPQIEALTVSLLALASISTSIPLISLTQLSVATVPYIWNCSTKRESKESHKRKKGLACNLAVYLNARLQA